MRPTGFDRLRGGALDDTGHDATELQWNSKLLTRLCHEKLHRKDSVEAFRLALARVLFEAGLWQCDQNGGTLGLPKPRLERANYVLSGRWRALVILAMNVFHSA